MNKGFTLTDEDYIRFCELVKERTGILIGDTRRPVLSRTIKENARRSGCLDINGYFSLLNSAKTDSGLWDELIKQLTINETYFFRHREQIDALRKHILPDIIARHWSDRTLRIWSAGCATGEEPYTLAILLRQLIPDIGRWKLLILATDINRQALDFAASARYREWSFREVDLEIRERYFERKKDRFILDPVIRQMVTFAYLNLAEDSYPSPLNQTSYLDLILCRNVSIYLPKNIIKEMADRFFKCLSVGGWLVLGPSETGSEFYSRFQMLTFNGSTVYQKIGISSPQFMRTTAASNDVLSIPSFEMSPQTNFPARRFPLPDETPAPHVSAVSERDIPSMDTSAELLEQAKGFIKQFRYDDARSCLLKYLAQKPDSVEAQYRMACLEANAGRLDDARQWAQKALMIEPLRSDIRYVLAMILQSQGDIEEAIGQLKKVIYLDPDFILAHFSIFHLYEKEGRTEEARRHRTTAVSLALRLAPDTVLAGSDDLTAAQVISLADVADG